jgi:hypothetical protein
MKHSHRSSFPTYVSCFTQSFSIHRFFNWLPASSAAVLVGLMLLGAGHARGQAPATKPAPDVLIFSNGDQLTGKFLRSVGGNAVFHSDMAGDLTVSWDKIKEIHSSSKFVVLAKGFHPGRKALPAHLPDGNLTVENKQIELTASDGVRAAPIPLANVAYVIDEPTFNRELTQKRGFFSEWTGNATAGATLVEATQDTTTFSGGVALVRTVPAVGWLDPSSRTSLHFIGSYGKVTEPDTPTVKTAIYHADAEQDEFLSTRFFALGQVAFDHNFSQSLDLQQIYGGGLGWTIMKKANQTLDLKGTLQYERQAFIDATPGENQNLVGSTFATNYMRKIGKNVIFTQQLEYIPAWNYMHAYSANETNALILPVYKRLSFSLGTVDSYLNDPAVTVPPTKRNSFQFTMGATYTLPPPK